MTNPTRSYHDLWNQSQSDLDPAVSELIDAETERQARKLIFIPSESFCIKPVREALSSTFTNIYSEGYPRPRMKEESEPQLRDHARQLSALRRYSNRRFYKGTENVDILECLTQERIAEAFANDRVPADRIHVNIQPLSGAAANNSIYEAFVSPGDTVMGLELAHGGHLTHGSPFNRSGKRYDIVSYEVDSETERLDYNRIRKKAVEHDPKMIIAGFTSYPWAPDWEAFRDIADEVDALLLADIAHTAGLVIGGAHPSPVGIADVVNFTTHKSAFGPRGAVVMTTDPDLASSIDYSIFPGEQGGPHPNKFAAMATAFKIANTEPYRNIQQRIVKNARALSDALEEEGLRVPYGGTDTHLLLVDVSAESRDSDRELWGEVAARILDLAGLVANKNTIPGDENAADARGVRFGTPWLTQRGFQPEDMDQIANLIARIIQHIHPFQYQGATRILPRGKIELDILRDVASETARLAERAHAEDGSIPGEDQNEDTPRDDYPHFLYLEEEGGFKTPLAEHHYEEGMAMDRHGAGAVPLRFAGTKRELEAISRSGVLIDRSDAGLLEVSDWRADALLEEATTRNVMDLDPGEGHRTYLLDADANVIDDIYLHRLETRTFLLITGPEQYEEVLTWLRALSDGYVIFDREDVRRKVQGPAVVRNRRHPDDDRPLTAFRVTGENTPDQLSEVYGLPELSKHSSWTPGDQTGIDHVFYHGYWEETGHTYTLAVPVQNAVHTWKTLRKTDLQPAGLETSRELRGRRGFQMERDEGRPPAEDMMDKTNDRFDFSKSYFVGQLELETKKTETEEKPAYQFDPEERDEPLETPLHDRHVEMGARMIPFGGWNMPVQYEGILEEHRAVRNRAGLFDVGHMGVLSVTGRDAKHFLDLVTTNYASWLRDGESQYSFILTPDGVVMDDLLLYRRGPEDFFMVVNAANKERVEDWLHAVNSGEYAIDYDRKQVERSSEVEIRDLKTMDTDREGRMDLALQGPESFHILEDLIEDPDLVHRIDDLKRFEFLEGEVHGMDLIISRTGYTGEAVGFELYVHPAESEKLWDLLMETGSTYGLAPCGLGARDTVRVEAGLPLHGNDLGGEREISPFAAGYGAFVKYHKPFFIGREAVDRREEERTEEIVRFRTETAGRPIREEDRVADPDTGTCIGVVTSTLVKRGEQMGLALLDMDYTDRGQELALLSDRTLDRDVEEIERGEDLSDFLEDARRADVLSRFLTPDDAGEAIGWGEEE